MQSCALTRGAEFLHFARMTNSPLEKAISAAGGSAAFRARVGISARTLANWRAQGVPDQRWGDVAAATSGAVDVSALALERARKTSAAA
jgi:hypothetical protein